MSRSLSSELYGVRRAVGALVALNLAPVVACAAPQAVGPTAEPATAPAAVASAESAVLAQLPWADSELLPGEGCSSEPLPEWSLDEATHRAMLSVGISVPLPAGWIATLERPQLVVVAAPETVDGVRPTFEVFVSPKCDSVRMGVAQDRVATRGLSELVGSNQLLNVKPEDARSVGLGGPGESVVLVGLTIHTAKGPRTVTVYGTTIGGATSFEIRGSAICATADPVTDPCAEAYRTMIKQTR